jgi:formate dehydrogenase maturation protein FdhE
MGKYCPVCGGTSGAAKFCYKDGTKLVDRVKCECENELHPVDVFCPECGKKVEKDG